MRKWNAWWIALSLLGGCLLFGPSALAGKRDEARALWITRWACNTPEDIQRMAANASQFNFNMLLFRCAETPRSSTSPISNPGRGN